MRQRGFMTGADGVAVTAIALELASNLKTVETRGIDRPATPLARG
jgi:hypothetical protein